ncbi:hypothetical protein SH580_10525 [Coraliomargarita algicola]|uniref:PEP-CTERM protein-sorting domain-containing protein n=1 Tax=Coraliomargarita algicola TaxID=3092156 RepID=A0ABZ0RYR2_9BACT|nr:hypothetical protein [Coraliomargarita sp. J2-16]WPJ98134.1 hypothetical protein SH580_10525 [Coraliomargarita sp. J2-16]
MRSTSKLPIVCLVALFVAGSASAAVNVTLEAVGVDVVATVTGTANLTDLTYEDSGNFGGGGLSSSAGSFLVGTGEFDIYSLLPSIPFGPGGNFTSDSNTGSALGVFFYTTITTLLVPADYASGESLNATSTFNNKTIADIGATPGSYVWNWGTGANADSVTLTVVPESNTYAALAGIFALACVAMRRRK